MSLPLVQLGPGGDYVRQVVSDGGQLRVVDRPYGDVRPVSRPSSMQRPGDDADLGVVFGVGSSPRGIGAVFARLVGLARWLGVLASPVPAHVTVPSRTSIEIARRYRTSRRDLSRTPNSRGNAADGRVYGVDRIEISRAALQHAAGRRNRARRPHLHDPNGHPPLGSSESDTHPRSRIVSAPTMPEQNDRARPFVFADAVLDRHRQSEPRERKQVSKISVLDLLECVNVGHRILMHMVDWY